MSEPMTIYCPHCERRISGRIPGLGQAYGRCPHCQGQPILWPADLPVPTRANVRALWAFSRSQPQGQTAEQPESNARGRWNG